ncbi:MAG TPA: DUF6152 family protein [Bryobacteraceae bacterium]|nr:DUF6152 family protein [Bryobacteraceae bacterium]
MKTASALALLFAALPVSAHHSFSAEFDIGRRVNLRGQITKVEWENPHVYIYVDVKQQNGRLENWACEAAGPNTLAHQGWDRNSFRVGDRVLVIGYSARDGSRVASAREVVLPDGRKIFTGVAGDGGPRL